LFLRDRTLMAQRFDPGRFETRGDASPVAEQVDSPPPGLTVAFGVSQNGVLAYTSGAVGNAQLTWYDRSGTAHGTVGTPGFGMSAAISPDGSTVAFDRAVENGKGTDVWLLDLERGSESRFTVGPGPLNAYPIWSPDSSHIAYFSLREGSALTYLKARDGTGEERAVDPQPRIGLPLDYSPDGQYIVEAVEDPRTKRDIWVVPLSPTEKPFAYLNTEFDERDAKISPNGHGLAYVSNETGRDEVYWQTFPKPGEKKQISPNGGSFPLWSRDAKELYYISADRKLMAVEVKTNGGTIQPGSSKALFPVRLDHAQGYGFAYDVGKDVRFLIPTPVERPGVPFTVVVNWAAGLKK
jgi:Tol biopolymer transport system component